MCPHQVVSGRELRKGGGTSRGGLGSCGIGWWVGWLALKCWRCMKKLVPYVWKLVLSQISVERGVLYPDEHSLLDGPGLAVDFLVNNAELVGVHGMACGGV